MPFKFFESQDDENKLNSSQTIKNYDPFPIIKYDEFCPNSDLDEIQNNFNDLDFLNKKFDELREKEIDGHITDVEKILLYEVLEKRILEFPNPYLPKDYEEGQMIARRYESLKREFDKKYGNKEKVKKWTDISSWLD